MSTIFNPFNFDPVSVQVLTNATTFTIPADKYAHVAAYCHNGAEVSIDGIVALKSKSSESWDQYHTDNIVQIDLALNDGFSYTVENEATFEGFLTLPNNMPSSSSNNTIYCYVSGELAFRATRFASGVVSITDRLGQDVVLPYHVKLGDGDIIENRRDGGYWDDPENQIQISGYEKVVDSVVAHSAGTSESNQFWLPANSQVSTSGVDASAVISLYNKL